MFTKKVYISIGIVFMGMIGGLFPIQAYAQTTGELQAQIADLQRQIQKLQTKLFTITQVSAPIELITPTRDFEGIEKWYAGIPNDFIFEKRLEYGQINSSVKYLQIVLNTYSNTSVAFVGPGSLRKETTRFGPRTKAAVIKFQEKFSDEILAPWKFKRGTGIVGPTTRKVLNLLITSNRSFLQNEVEQGDTLVIVAKSISEVAPTGTFKSEKVDFMKVPNSEKWIGIVGIDIKEASGIYPFVLTFSDGSVAEEDIIIRKKIFPRTVLQISKDLTQQGYTPASLAQTILGKENVSFGEIFKIYTPTAYFNKEFILPLDAIKIVGGYGNIRKQGEIGLHHLGVDLEVPTGTSVYAINDGVVRYTKESTIYGRAILIDHGLGVYSAYLHLNEFQAAEGQQVKRGDIIGFSGNTGYSLAPHLHFSIRTAQGSVDPLRFIDAVNKAICNSNCSETILTFGLKVLIPSQSNSN